MKGKKGKREKERMKGRKRERVKGIKREREKEKKRQLEMERRSDLDAKRIVAAGLGQDGHSLSFSSLDSRPSLLQ